MLKKLQGDAFLAKNLQRRIELLEARSLEILRFAVKTETEFAESDLKRGVSYQEVVSSLKKRYSRRFWEPIIKSLEKEGRRK